MNEELKKMLQARKLELKAELDAVNTLLAGPPVVVQSAPVPVPTKQLPKKVYRKPAHGSYRSAIREFIKNLQARSFSSSFVIESTRAPASSVYVELSRMVKRGELSKSDHGTYRKV